MRVLIVEDQFLISEYLKVWVEAFGMEVVGVATSADDAVSLAVAQKPDTILMDVRLDGDADGVDAALRIGELIQTRFIYVTGSSEPSTLARIHLDHPAAILIKPVDPQDLQRALLSA